MKLHWKTTAALSTLAAWPAAAQPAPPAPSALETLGAMHHTGSTADWPEVPQTGQKANQVRQTRNRVTSPPAFHSPFSPGGRAPRHIAVGPQGVATFVGT